MSSMSTPISQIRNNSLNNQQTHEHNMPIQMPIYNPNVSIDNNQQNNHQMGNQTQNALVDELLTELETQPEYQQDTNVAHSQYAMDNVNVPPKYNSQTSKMLNPEDTRPVSTNINNQPVDDSYMFSSTTNTTDKINNIFNQIKPILIVFIIFLVLSLHQVNRIIFSFVPRLLLENGQLSLYAIILKSFLASLLYYLFMMLI
jgi:hypothetical protein